MTKHRPSSISRSPTLPGYDELFRRWEKQQWSASLIDLSHDRQTLQAATSAQRQQFFQIGRFAGFFHAEAGVTESLVPFLQAVPELQHRLYLVTQLADEGKHVIFLHRVYQEVILQGGDNLLESLAACRPWLSPAMEELVGDALPKAAERLRRTPDDIGTLVEAVTLYHLVIEAGLGMTCLRAALRGLKKLGGFPGICAGFAAMLRDEKRHVLFGVRFLRDMLAADQAQAKLIARCLDTWMPVVFQILERSNGIDSQTRINYAGMSMRRQLDNIGLERPWRQAS